VSVTVPEAAGGVPAGYLFVSANLYLATAFDGENPSLPDFGERDAVQVLVGQ
jgi:hypothetical protein